MDHQMSGILRLFQSNQIKSNYWFKLQTFIREDDSDAQNDCQVTSTL